MNKENWFSTKLRFAVVIHTEGTEFFNDQIYLLKAYDFELAFKKAFGIGKNNEKNYSNFEEKKVSWIFVEILALDLISAKDLDGVEIYSEPVPLSTELVSKYRNFDPKDSKPIQTI